MPFPDYVTAKPKVIMFTDFDGTITFRDSNQFLIRRAGCGDTVAKKMKKEIVDGRITFKDGYKSLLDSIKLPYDDCMALLREEIELDTGFRTFYYWAKANGVPIVILSGGMGPFIRELLFDLLGLDAEDIELVCNDLVARDGKCINDHGGWQIKYRDDSADGNDKALFIRPYKDYSNSLPAQERPILLYAGDGISDLKGAKETDLLFARAGEDLAKHCAQKGFGFIPFQNWDEILAVTKAIHSGALTVRPHNFEDSYWP